jgi:hypothetical protein
VLTKRKKTFKVKKSKPNPPNLISVPKKKKLERKSQPNTSSQKYPTKKPIDPSTCAK